MQKGVQLLEIETNINQGSDVSAKVEYEWAYELLKKGKKQTRPRDSQPAADATEKSEKRQKVEKKVCHSSGTPMDSQRQSLEQQKLNLPFSELYQLLTSLWHHHHHHHKYSQPIFTTATHAVRKCPLAQGKARRERRSFASIFALSQNSYSTG